VVEKYLPPGKGGNILITSRNAELKRITLSKNSMEVLVMPNEEAISLLLQSAMLHEAPAYILDVAGKLVSELGGIPLAIDQAGGYMLSCGCSIDDYLELYAKHRDELMSSPKFRGASNYGTSTYGTWDVAMHEIERIAAKGVESEAHAAQSAINLLRIFAFLDHANIPQELFKNAAANYIERNIDEEAENGLPLSVKLLDHKTLYLSEEGIWDKFQFLYGIQVLLSFSLIKSHNHMYSMHQIVNAWNRSRLPKGESSALYQKARAVLSCSIVFDYAVDNHTYCQMLVPHLRSSTLHALEMKLESTYYDDEYERFVLVFYCMGDWNAMEKLLQMTVNERNTRLGYHHLMTLMSMNNLANTYIYEGRYDEAEKLHWEVMNARKTKLGLDHPATRESINNLAMAYSGQGRWDEAEKLQLEVMYTKLGLDHPNTLLKNMNNLALTYSNQGRWDEAEKLELEVMNTSKTKLGLDHPNTLLSMNNLAKTYIDQGRRDEAEKLELEVMGISKTKLGLDHQTTLGSMNNLAMAYSNQGRWDEAEKLQLEVMDIHK
jgi:tetratricopeptide (TPR) repeat protein